MELHEISNQIIIKMLSKIIELDSTIDIAEYLLFINKDHFHRLDEEIEGEQRKEEKENNEIFDSSNKIDDFIDAGGVPLHVTTSEQYSQSFYHVGELR